MIQVALSYVSHDMTSGFGCCDSGGIVIVDLLDGEITHHLDIDEQFQKVTAWLGEWTAEGLMFAPRCNNCTPKYEISYLLWHPEQNAIADTGIFHNWVYAERLTTTGELLYADSNIDFPVGGVGYPGNVNVISIYQAEENPDEIEGQIVFFDLDHIDFDTPAHWIANGKAFLVNESIIVFRDGHQVGLEYETPQRFLTMTTNGWLTFELENYAIHQYIVGKRSISHKLLYQSHSQIELANVQLQQNQIELPPFEINLHPPADITFCPGTMPTRLEIGDWAQLITPYEESIGSSLILDDDDSENSESINSEFLPLGAHIQVVGGIRCESNGTQYINVSYQGRIGWIMESMWTSYNLAPVETSCNLFDLMLRRCD